MGCQEVSAKKKSKSKSSKKAVADEQAVKEEAPKAEATVNVTENATKNSTKKAKKKYKCIGGDCLEGVGVMKWDKGRYEGEFEEGLFNGRGVEYNIPGPAKYEGMWKRGLRNRLGKQTVGEDHWFMGEWKDNSIGGCGVMRDPSATYVGYWNEMARQVDPPPGVVCDEFQILPSVQKEVDLALKRARQGRGEEKMTRRGKGKREREAPFQIMHEEIKADGTKTKRTITESMASYGLLNVDGDDEEDELNEEEGGADDVHVQEEL